jgi:hypothetical protein
LICSKSFGFTNDFSKYFDFSVKNILINIDTMPTHYIKRESGAKLPVNTGAFQTKHMGVRVYHTNRRYVHKKSAGIVTGTALSLVDCLNIKKMLDSGCTKKSLCQRYKISRYYLNKVLKVLS